MFHSAEFVGAFEKPVVRMLNNPFNAVSKAD
jgi:hypothetical protein